MRAQAKAEIALKAYPTFRKLKRFSKNYGITAVKVKNPEKYLNSFARKNAN